MIKFYQQFSSLKALFKLQNLQKCLIFKISIILHKFNKNNLFLKKYKQFLLIFMLFFTLITSLIKWKIYWKVLTKNLSSKYLIKDFIFVIMLKVLILFKLHHDTIFDWSTTRFICMRCWLRIFCKLCLSEELNNLINRAVTAWYAHVMLTYMNQALHCNAHKQQDHVIK